MFSTFIRIGATRNVLSELVKVVERLSITGEKKKEKKKMNSFLSHEILEVLSQNIELHNRTASVSIRELCFLF